MACNIIQCAAKLLLDMHLPARLTQEASAADKTCISVESLFPNKLMLWIQLLGADDQQEKEDAAKASFQGTGPPSGEFRPCLGRWTRLLSVQSSGWCLRESHILPWISCPQSDSPQCPLCQCHCLLPPSENSSKCMQSSCSSTCRCSSPQTCRPSRRMAISQPSGASGSRIGPPGINVPKLAALHNTHSANASVSRHLQSTAASEGRHEALALCVIAAAFKQANTGIKWHI